jgi:SAM-dependent methyltransferase
MKPFSDACERNREPILKILKQWFTQQGTVLEIGSGTGQHAVFFAEHLPHLTWLTTDREENLSGIRSWIETARLPNVQGPVALDVSDEAWPLAQAAYVFSANTTHIMGWPEVEAMFTGIGRVLQPGGVFCLYGPFNAAGEFTSDSNRDFDAALRRRDPRMGLRDDRAIMELAHNATLEFSGDYPMPANNRMLVWGKTK